jgi:hypothetical protein
VIIGFVTGRVDRFRRIDAWLRANLTPIDDGGPVQVRPR